MKPSIPVRLCFLTPLGERLKHDLHDGRRRIDQRKVIQAIEARDAFDIITDRKPFWHDLIIGTHDDVQIRRISAHACDPITVRDLAHGSSKKSSHGTITKTFVVGTLEIQNWGQRHHQAWLDHRRAARILGQQLGAPSDPHGQLTPGGVPDDCNLRWVDLVGRGEMLEVIDRVANVNKGVRPPTFTLPDPAVFDVPHRVPLSEERFDHRGHDREIGDAPLPEAAMNDNDDRRWLTSTTFRHRQPSKGGWSIAIDDELVSHFVSNTRG